jgi:hypothetical protein
VEAQVSEQGDEDRHRREHYHEGVSEQEEN